MASHFKAVSGWAGSRVNGTAGIWQNDWEMALPNTPGPSGQVLQRISRSAGPAKSSVADDQHRRLLHVVHHRLDLLLVGLRIGHSRAGFGDGFEEIERIAALQGVVHVQRQCVTDPSANAC